MVNIEVEWAASNAQCRTNGGFLALGNIFTGERSPPIRNDARVAAHAPARARLTRGPFS